MNTKVDWDAYLATRRINSYTDRDLVKPYLTGRLLEIGCGYGHFTAWCRELGCQVAGIDPSPTAIAEAKRMTPDGDFRVGMADALPYSDNLFDSLVSLEVIEHDPKPSRFMAEAFRVMKPGGWLVVQTPNYPVKRMYDFLHWIAGRKPNMKDDPTHVSPFSALRLKRLAEEAGFRVDRLVGRNILGENRFPFLRRWKGRPSGRWFWQKTIIIAQKPRVKTD